MSEGIAVPAEDAGDSDTGKRYSPEVWAEVEAHFECGTMSVVEISKTYGMSDKAIRGHCARNGVIRNAKKAELKRKAEEKIIGATAAAEDPKAVIFEQKRAGRVIDVKESTHNLNKLVFARAAMIARDIHAGTRKESECAADFKSLLQLQKTVTLNYETQMDVLDADQLVDASQLPELIIRDLSKEEIAQMASADDDGEFDVELPPVPTALTEDEDDVIIEEGGS